MSATIKDVAAYAQVSPTTVSRVVNQKGYVSGDARRRVLDAIEALGYTPNLMAISLSQKRMHTIGVIVPDICNSFFNEVFYAASKLAEQHNYRVILYNTDDSVEMETCALQDMMAYRVSGVIITPVSDTDGTNAGLLNALKDSGVPVVFVDREMRGASCDGVFVDNVRGAYAAAELLLRAGHRKIAVIAGPQDTIPGRERLLGYTDAMRDHGVTPDPDHVVTCDFRMEKSFHATMQLLGSANPPTAFFTCNNLMTLGCLQAILSCGKQVPNDAALVGFDDIPLLDTLGFHISAVSRATAEMGTVAMQLLLNQLGGGSLSHCQRIVLQSHLIVRGSEVLPAGVAPA